MARSPSGGRWRRRTGRAGPVSARAVRGCATRVPGIPAHRVAGQGRHHGRLRSGQHLSGDEGYAGTVRGLRHPGVARCECLAAGGHRPRVPGRRGRRLRSGVHRRAVSRRHHLWLRRRIFLSGLGDLACADRRVPGPGVRAVDRPPAGPHPLDRSFPPGLSWRIRKSLRFIPPGARVCRAPGHSFKSARHSAKVLTRKTAISARVTGSSGQKLASPQPPVIPSAASCSIQATAQ